MRSGGDDTSPPIPVLGLGVPVDDSGNGIRIIRDDRNAANRRSLPPRLCRHIDLRSPSLMLAASAARSSFDHAPGCGTK